MFGKNEIVGQKAFPDDDRLLVTSYFATLQGEGPFSGKRAVFLRLAKCNLACSFCDTYFDSGDWYSLQSIASALSSLVDDTKEWGLVITGGEPLLQKAISPFLNNEVHWWAWTQIESNGIVPQAIPDETTLVVSPKCAERNGVATKYLRPHRFNLENANCLKFVMSADDGPYSTIPDWALEWKWETGKEIYVSPMNIYNREPEKAKAARNSNEVTIEQRSNIEEVISFWEPGLLDLEANELNHKHTANYAVAHNLRFQLQAHLYAGMA
jgi:organic radical activating enzyme